MTRVVGSLLVFSALAMTLAAQDPPADPPAKDGKANVPGLFDGIRRLFGGGNPPANPEPLKKADPVQDPNAPPANEGDPKDGDPKDAGSQENPDEIIQRLKKNFNATEERLDKKDPGADTVKLQQQIIDDIDKLLKQQQNNNSGGGGGGGGGGGNAGGGGGNSGGGNAGGGGQKQNQGGNGGAGGKDDKQNAGGDGGGKEKDKDQAKNDPKDGGGAGGKDDQKKKQGDGGKEPKDNKDDQAKNDPPPKGGDGDGKQKGGGGTKGDSDRKPPTVSDLYKNPWGHLPEKRRQEMDAYGREHFPRKYEQLLREYYRTIAEQDSRKE